MKSGILTEELVREAIALATPSINAILWSKGTTWGPKWVAVAVDSAWLPKPVIKIVGQVKDWKKEWGEPENFEEIALAKLQLAFSTGENTGYVVAYNPWRLTEGDYLYRGGVARNGLAVAASGAYGETDEGIAGVVLEIVAMLCNLQVLRMREEGIAKI